MKKISQKHIARTINHWLRTPVGSYFGSSFGNNVERALLTEMSQGDADLIIDKLKRDEPVPRFFPDGIDIYMRDSGYDKKMFFIRINNIEFEIE